MLCALCKVIISFFFAQDLLDRSSAINVGVNSMKPGLDSVQQGLLLVIFLLNIFPNKFGLFTQKLICERL